MTMTENKILGFWIIVMVAATVVAAMSFAMLIGFIMGIIAAFSGSAIVCSYVLLADVRDRDEIAAHEASHIAELGVHERMN
jgi:hypothetical protein